MIVSYQHKFVFAAIPKTGTHAVRQALRAHLDAQDIEQVGLFVRKEFPIPELARLKHGHISLQQLKESIPEAQFESFFKFAFVRNPFDRFISYCAFMTRLGGEFRARPQQVMNHYVQNPPHGHVLFWPQVDFISNRQGGLLANYVGRVERMQQSYDEIAERIGVPTSRLATVNASDREHYRSYYTPALVDAVTKLYVRDLQAFDYEF